MRIPDSALLRIEKTTLPNRLRVITETMPHVRSVSVGVWVTTGSREEDASESGVSHFIEHMLFKGTENRSVDEIARTVDSLGGNLDAFTAKEMVCYNAKVLDEHLPIAFDVIADMVQHPLFEEEDIEKEKGVILEELKMENDNPEYVVHETFSEHFWPDHPVGRPIIGTRETIGGFSRALLLDYFARHYTPERLIVTAAGNVEHEAMVRLAENLFQGAVPVNGRASRFGAPGTAARITMEDRPAVEQAHVSLGVPAYRLDHPCRFAAYILNVILGACMSSRLFQEIREEQGLAYTVFSDLTAFHDTGCLSVYAGTAVESVRQVIASVLRQFRDLAAHHVSPEELRRAKDHLKGSMLLNLESTSSRMSNLARQELYFGRFFELEEIVERVESVTAEGVRQVAEELLVPDRIALTVLGNLEGLVIEREELTA